MITRPQKVRKNIHKIKILKNEKTSKKQNKTKNKQKKDILKKNGNNCQKTHRAYFEIYGCTTGER